MIVRFLCQYNFRMLSRQRSKKKNKEDNQSKKKNKEDKVPGLQKWHSTFREPCIRFGKDENFDSKWGRFKPHQRLNVDQSPLPFVINAKRTTYEYAEPGAKDHNTCISQPGSGLDKR